MGTNEYYWTNNICTHIYKPEYMIPKFYYPIFTNVLFALLDKDFVTHR